jgi:hypothetical protein
MIHLSVKSIRTLPHFRVLSGLPVIQPECMLLECCL